MKKFAAVFFIVLIVMSVLSVQAFALLSVEDETGITYVEDPSCVTKIAPPETETEPQPENPIKRAASAVASRLKAFSDKVEAVEFLWAIAPAAFTAILAMILIQFHKSMFVFVSSILLIFGYLSLSLIQNMLVPLAVGLCLSIVVAIIFILASKREKSEETPKAE